MEIRLWNYGEDDRYISSFLKVTSLAHKEPEKTKEWFKWKFEQSPYGKAILACAFDGDIVAGCVALGCGYALYKGKYVKYALSYETFVNPDFQGQGLFKKLIALAEIASKQEGIQFLYNFPNTNSLPGFKRMGWREQVNEIIYRLYPVHLVKLLFHYKDLKKPFNPLPCMSFKVPDLAVSTILYTTQETFTPQWDRDYLKWRFFSFPSAQYAYIDNDTCFGIARVGYRGTIRECQILYISNRTGNSLKCAFEHFINYLKKHEKPDIIGCCCSTHSVFNKIAKCSLKVPTHANFTYRTLSDLIPDNVAMDIKGIDFHTY